MQILWRTRKKEEPETSLFCIRWQIGSTVGERLMEILWRTRKQEKSEGLCCIRSLAKWKCGRKMHGGESVAIEVLEEKHWLRLLLITDAGLNPAPTEVIRVNTLGKPLTPNCLAVLIMRSKWRFRVLGESSEGILKDTSSHTADLWFLNSSAIAPQKALADRSMHKLRL